MSCELPPITERLIRIYGAGQAPLIAERLQQTLNAWKGSRQPAKAQRWSEQQAVLITYGSSIQQPGQKPLVTLKGFLDKYLRGVVDSVHVLPFFPYSSDDGFSVIDYREVDAELGDWDDIRALAENFGLIVDLVINHCSRESLWFQDYLADQPPHNRWFREAEPSDNLALVTRPRSSPLLTEVRTRRGVRHLWTTFSADQVDLDFRNPEVLIEMIDILLGYIAAGARVVRLDAIAYLWKEVGSRCIHLPQTHEVVKLLRDVLEQVQPDCLLLTETNVPNDENRSYFGDGDEAQLIYQFSLPPLLLHALHTGCTDYLQRWALELNQQPPPPGCTYLNFTASHDGVGLRPLEGLLPPQELNSLLDSMRARGGYVSSRRNSDGSESPYELNISYFEAFRDPKPASDPWHIPAFMLSQMVALSMQGIPALYIHSMTATPNDHVGVELSGRIRTINRRRWDLGELESLMADPDSATGQVFPALARMLKIRSQQPAFHPLAGQQVLEMASGLFGLVRTACDDGQRLVCLFNFTPTQQQVDLQSLFSNSVSLVAPTDLCGSDNIGFDHGRLLMGPYAACWLVDE